METPSQSRYVGYYEMMMQNGGQLPSPRPITITKITITGMMFVGKGNGDDFWFNIDRGRQNQVFRYHSGLQLQSNLKKMNQGFCLHFFEPLP